MKKKWPIDRIRNEALPRLVPHRRPGALHLVALVSLKDCTPFLGTWPPDFDEVVAVVTRLLLVPGGPLVLEDGQTSRLRRLARRCTAFGCTRIWMSGLYLVCYDGDLVSEPADVPQPISRAHRAALARTVRHTMKWSYWASDAFTRALLETPPRADLMLAGLPAKEGNHGEA